MVRKEFENEKLILIQVANGDKDAFRQIFDYYKDQIYSYAFNYLKSKELSEEIVQEVFLRIWIKKSSLITVHNFGGYIRTVTKNLTLDFLKKKALDYQIIKNNQFNWTEVDDTTEETIIFNDSKAYLNLIIERLPKQQKLVYRMCQLEGFKQKEVAELLKISPLTVKVHLREASKTLKTLLSNNNPLIQISLTIISILL